ncbi:hypothetical protein FS320_34660 [Microvirga tunisiensis]|uniref:Uncharacterized protein n=1 Tax=Microvirga tunisiensis TaxID=2108360 RepID=A0A5N7MST1_9HYPH|nr:hypothetical protein [Microvirga tunisiensis]MPR30061.1 hypothetical protein [Microvirga tunisiensis]
MLGAETRDSTGTDEEIEVVAEELAKAGGLSWYPGRIQGPILRVVSDRYRDRTRVAIAALECLRASKQGFSAPKEAPALETPLTDGPYRRAGSGLQVGTVVVYRPPGDRRAVPCRIENLEEGRAYLVPFARPDIGWVALETFQPSSVGCLTRDE